MQATDDLIPLELLVVSVVCLVVNHEAGTASCDDSVDETDRLFRSGWGLGAEYLRHRVGLVIIGCPIVELLDIGEVESTAGRSAFPFAAEVALKVPVEF